MRYGDRLGKFFLTVKILGLLTVMLLGTVLQNLIVRFIPIMKAVKASVAKAKLLLLMKKALLTDIGRLPALVSRLCEGKGVFGCIQHLLQTEKNLIGGIQNLCGDVDDDRCALVIEQLLSFP